MNENELMKELEELAKNTLSFLRKFNPDLKTKSD